MILADDVVEDSDMVAPQPFQVLRSSGAFVAGGFTSTTTTLLRTGPVQRASDKEVNMLPEADRVGGVMAFWSTEPIYVTSGKRPVPAVLGQTPAGAVPGTVYTLPTAVPTGSLYLNGLLQLPGADYTLVGNVLTLNVATAPNAVLYFTTPITDADGPAESDILVYPPNGEQYRVLASRHFPGSGFWKALGTRLSAI